MSISVFRVVENSNEISVTSGKKCKMPISGKILKSPFIKFHSEI